MKTDTQVFVIYRQPPEKLDAQEADMLPIPAYIPSDGEFIHAVFAPAHFIDAKILRRDYWKSQRAERTARATPQ